jgi:hypothetical protein
VIGGGRMILTFGRHNVVASAKSHAAVATADPRLVQHQRMIKIAKAEISLFGGFQRS